jgi:hypothetical protein
MENVRSPTLSDAGDGQLTALGYLQIGTGSLTLMMSAMALAQIMIGPAEMLNPANAFSSSANLFDRAIATYVVLQLTVGWVAGGLQLAAGACCLRGKAPRLVGLASLVSLVNFPHGTIAAAFMLHGLRRPEIIRAFHPSSAAG